MDLAEQIKIAYEQVGFAVIDVNQIPETPIFEMDFIGPEGLMKKKVVTFFAILAEPNAAQSDQRQQ